MWLASFVGFGIASAYLKRKSISVIQLASSCHLLLTGSWSQSQPYSGYQRQGWIVGVGLVCQIFTWSQFSSSSFCTTSSVFWFTISLSVVCSGDLLMQSCSPRSGLCLWLLWSLNYPWGDPHPTSELGPECRGVGFVSACSNSTSQSIISILHSTGGLYTA